MTEPGMIEIPTFGLIILMFAPLAIFGMMWAMRNWKRISDTWNLTFRRARTVQADMHTVSGSIVTKFVVPDSRGMFTWRKGTYHFDQNVSKQDGRFGIPRMAFVEMQIAPESGKIATKKVKLSVEEIGENGERKTIEKVVDQYMISHAGLRPQLLALAHKTADGWSKLDEPPVTAVEVHDLMASKIVADCTNASIADLKMEQIFWAVIISGVLLLLGVIAIYAKLNSMSEILHSLQTINAIGKGV